MDLTGVMAKLNRADEHLATLDASLRSWGNSNPYTYTGKDNPDKTEIRFYIRMNVEPALTRWGLLAGDCVHNLRSALDHLAWQAALVNGPPPSGTEFPIFKDSGPYFDRRRGGGLYKIRGIKDPNQRALIERLQPWQNPNGFDNDALWIIHELDRMDKHRVLTPILVIPRALSPHLVIEYPTDEIAKIAGAPLIETPDVVIEDGAEAFSLHFALPFKSVKVRGKLTIGVALEHAGHQGGLTGTLRELCKHGRRVVQEFRDALA